MPLYRIQAPNGRTYEIEGPEGASQQQVINAVLAQHPEAGQEPKDTTGIFERGAKGAESLISQQRTGIESLFGGDYAEKALGRQQAIAEKYPGQSDWEAVKGKYEKEGLLSAAGEYLSRVPGALAEQAPQIAESMAAARAGSLAGPGGAVTGAFAPSYLQLYGSHLERQAEEQRQRGEAVDPSRLTAAAAAVPAALIDTVTTFIPMGKGIVKSLFGKEVEQLLFKGATKEAELAAAKKLAQEGLPKTLGKGLFKGAAYEIPGEVAQQAIERFQAGLPLLDDDALKEYGETAFQTSMLAPIGAAGRVHERGAARDLVEQDRQETAAKQRAAEAKAEEERRNSPEYIKDFASSYEEAQQAFNEMRDVVKKPGKDALPAEQAQYKEDKAALDELGKSLYAGSSEYKRVKPLYDKMMEDERYNAMSPEERLMESVGVKQAAPAETAEPEAETAPQYTVDEMGRVVEAGKEQAAPETPEQTYAANYAAQQLQRATDFGQLMLDDKVAYLMDNPAMAKLLVDNNVQIPGVSPQENKTILSALRLQLRDTAKAAEKERTTAAAERGAQDTDLLKKQIPGAEAEPSTAFDELVSFAEESKGKADEELRHLDTVFVDGLTNPDTSAITVGMKPVGGSAKKPAQIREKVEAAFQEADKADQEYLAARRSSTPDVAKAAQNRATAAVQKLDALAETSGEYAAELIKLRRAQIDAWGRLNDALNDLRAGEVLDSSDPEKRKFAASTKATLQKQAERARSDLITSVLQEAATNRRASWQQLSKDEAIKGADRIRGLVDSWIQRAAEDRQPAQFEDVIVEPAQMRGDKIVRAAKTERRLIKSPIARLSAAEQEHFTQSIRGAIADLLTTPAAAVSKETPLLKTQFKESEAERISEERGETKAGKPGELTRLREYVGNKLNKALGKDNLDDDLRSNLEAAQGIIEDGKASQNLLDIVDHIAERVLTGRTEGLKTKFEKDPTKPGRVREVQYIGETAQNMQELKDALRLSRGVAEDTSGQRQLDLLVEEPGQRPRLVEKDLGYIRMTPENFAKSPKVVAARAAADKLRAAIKRQKAKRAKLDTAVTYLQDAKDKIENIKANTKFFQAGDEKWSDKVIAELHVPPVPPLITKDMSDVDKTLARQEHDKLVAARNLRVQQLTGFLARGGIIEETDNELIKLMQNKNKAIRDDAAKLRAELKPWVDFLSRLQAEIKTKVTLTPAEKRVAKLLTKLNESRSKYEAQFNKVYSDYMHQMDQALGDLLDPLIQQNVAALDKAETALEKEKAELERVKANVDKILSQESGKDRMQLATYEQFRYEEKKGIIDELEKILDMDQPDRVVEVTFHQWETRVLAANGELECAFKGFVRVEHDDLVARGHHIAHPKFVEPKRIDQNLALGLGHFL